MDDSDHEEEFYYTEVEVTLDTVMQTFADMNTCSSPSAQTVQQSTQFRLPPDHDYQRKVRVEECLHLANRHIDWPNSEHVECLVISELHCSLSHLIMHPCSSQLKMDPVVECIYTVVIILGM